MTDATKPLHEIAEVKLGRQRSPKDHQGSQMRPYVRAANVGWEGLRLDDVKQMNFTDAEMATFRLQPGDVLVSEASGSRKEVGKAAIWNGEIEECAFQNTLIRVRPRAVEPRFLLHFLRHLAETGQIADRARGVGIYHLGQQALASTPVPELPIEKQRRIAAVLDQADELRAKRRTTLALLDTFTEAIFLDMFGDPVTNPMGWPEEQVLGQVADIASGITKGRKVPAGPTRTVPYLAVANVQDQRLLLDVIKTIEASEQEIARYRLRSGDLLLTEGGDPDKLGRGTIWNEDLPECIHQNHIFRVRLTDDRLTPRFASLLLASQRGKRFFLRRAKQTTGIASINKTQLSEFPLLVPPVELQHEFSDRLDAATAAGHRASTSNSQLDDLFASLQQRAFRGEL